MSESPHFSLLSPRERDKAKLQVIESQPEMPGPTEQHSADARKHRLRPKFIEAAVAVVDFLLIVAISLAGSAIYYAMTDGRISDALSYTGIGLIVGVNFTTIMTARRNYHLKVLRLFAKQVREIIFVWLGIFAFLAFVAFTMKISGAFSRGATILLFTGGLATLFCWRQMVASFISRSLSNGLFARKPIIVISEGGKSESSRSLAELLSYGFVPVKTFEISRAEIAASQMTSSLQSKLSNIIDVARTERIEDIYVLLRWHNEKTIDGIVDALSDLPISVHLMPDDNTARYLSYPVANVGTTRTAVLKRNPLTPVELAAKRCFDISLAALGILIVLPMMLLIAIGIKLDSRGPILFRQKRDGFNGRTFEIFKFRTMHVLEDGAVVNQATRDDPRITRFGRFLRRSSADELPQLFNVISGDMSLVGPRPHAVSHNSRYEKLIANYAFRHHVKPGLTGWAQVNGCRGETRQIEQMKWRVERDLWYINNWSPWLDLKIMLRTIVVTLWQDDAY